MASHLARLTFVRTQSSSLLRAFAAFGSGRRGQNHATGGGRSTLYHAETRTQLVNTNAAGGLATVATQVWAQPAIAIDVEY